MSTAQFVHNTPVPANYLGVAKTADGVPIWKYAMCVRCVTEARMESTPDLCAHTGVKALPHSERQVGVLIYTES